jgi:hypothetical protein
MLVRAEACVVALMALAGDCRGLHQAGTVAPAGSGMVGPAAGTGQPQAGPPGPPRAPPRLARARARVQGRIRGQPEARSRRLACALNGGPAVGVSADRARRAALLAHGGGRHPAPYAAGRYPITAESRFLFFRASS